MTTTASVLMSVYHRVPVDELKACLQSLKWQTHAPDQIVIVIDGPVSNELDQTLIYFQQLYSQQEGPTEVTLVRQAENLGLTAALNAGLEHCRGDYILRMDADDLSMPTRFEAQLSFLDANPAIDVLGTALYEFSTEPHQPRRIKPVKVRHEEIASSLGIRNPINHPTACIRRERLISAGGYLDLPLLEDYYLWSRLLRNGAKFHNLAAPLYLFRFDDETLVRRNGWENFKREVWLRKWMYQQNLISLPTLVFAASVQCVLRFAPVFLQRWLWKRSRQGANFKLDLPKADSIKQP